MKSLKNTDRITAQMTLPPGSDYKGIQTWSRWRRKQVRFHQGEQFHRTGAILVFTNGVYERQANGSLHLQPQDGDPRNN